MFQLRPAPDNNWQIVNLSEEMVFTGTLRQCEEWLDHYENVHLRPRRRPVAQLAARIRAMFGRLTARPARPAATAENCELPPQLR